MKKAIYPNKSAIPSPVIADVGTIEKYSLQLSFSQYNLEFISFAIKSFIVTFNLSHNSDYVNLDYLLNESKQLLS